MKANPTNGLSRLAHIMFTPDGIKDLEHYLDTYAIRPKEKKSFQDNFITSYIAFFHCWSTQKCHTQSLSV